MRTIQIPDATSCMCGALATLVRDGVFYCGPNCSAHTEARVLIGQLGHMIQAGRGGSPVALDLLAAIASALPMLEPTRPAVACPKCWGPMQGGATVSSGAGDGSLVAGERCPFCNHTRASGPDGRH